MAESPSDFIRARRWVNEQGASVFSSFASLEWCVRRHRAKLVESGQPLVRRSAGGAPIGPRFANPVLGILRCKRREAVLREAARMCAMDTTRDLSLRIDCVPSDGAAGAVAGHDSGGFK